MVDAAALDGGRGLVFWDGGGVAAGRAMVVSADWSYVVPDILKGLLVEGGFRFGLVGAEVDEPKSMMFMLGDGG